MSEILAYSDGSISAIGIGMTRAALAECASAIARQMNAPDIHPFGIWVSGEHEGGRYQAVVGGPDSPARSGWP